MNQGENIKVMMMNLYMYIFLSELELPVKIERLHYPIEELEDMEARPTTSYIDDPDDPDYVDPDDNNEHNNSNDMEYEEVEYLEIEDNKDALADRKLFLVNIIFFKSNSLPSITFCFAGDFTNIPLTDKEYPDLEQQFLD